MSKGKNYLLKGVTANGPGDWILLNGELKTLLLWGTLDGAAVTVEISMDPEDAGSIISVSELVLTTTGAKNTRIGAGIFVRGNVSGGGGSIDITLGFIG